MPFPDIANIDNLQPPFTIGYDEGIASSSPAYILGQCMIASGDEVTDVTDDESWPLFFNHLPDGEKVAHNAGCIYDTAGVLDGVLFETGEVIEHYGIQVRIRALTHAVGWAKIKDVTLFLQKLNNASVIVENKAYQIIHNKRTSSIVNIGQDAQRRFEFTVNFTTTIKQLTI